MSGWWPWPFMARTCWPGRGWGRFDSSAPVPARLRPGATSPRQPAGGLLGVVGDDDVRAGPRDRREHLQRDEALVQIAGGGRRLHHRVLTADVVGGQRQVE